MSAVPAPTLPAVPAPSATRVTPLPGARPVPPPAPMARRRLRHRFVFVTFLLFVAGPALACGWYLWERAQDQFASHVAFSVRKEETASAIELLGGITDLSGSSSADTDILYDFLHSQELVATLDAALDLRRAWTGAGADHDPVYAYDAPGTIEDLTDHWHRMVRVSYDSGTRLINLEVRAYDPDMARRIAAAIYEESSAMINRLSAIARADAIRYAQEELTSAELRLKSARLALQAFRNRTQVIDPRIQTQTQSGLIGALETKLADARIARDLLLETARTSDPRLAQANREIGVIERQIDAERAKLGLDGEGGERSVADLVGAFEALSVDLEFAQEAYTAARVRFDAAGNEARRQSRYLAAHVAPTLPERATFPDRPLTLGLFVLFTGMIWAIAVLVAYALRDRR